MDQSRALNALAPFLALAKSANSPRAASDLITQATSAPNTYVFAELLQQPNIRKLASDEQYSSHLTLLETFAYGTWESYKTASASLPPLSDNQQRKLRLLSLLTIAAEKASTTAQQQNNLSYNSLCTRLDLAQPRDLETLVTTAIYENLLTATLNPTAQTVVITSVAPLRDLAPGSVNQLLGELSAWSGRCDSVLADLQSEISRIEAQAVKRAAREGRKEKQIKAANEAGEKSSGAAGGTRSGKQVGKSEMQEEAEDDDAMELDSSSAAANGRKRGGAAGGTGRFVGGKQLR